MKQTLSLLLSLALPASASAASWFDAEIAGYTTWPTNPPAGEWSGTEGATLDAGRHVLRVDVPAGERLAFTPVAPRDAASAAFEQVGFVATNTLETVQPLEKLVPFEEPVKAALAAATDGSTTNFHGWAKDPGGATNVWLALAGATPAAGVATEVRVLFRTVGDELQVQYQVDGTALASAGGDEWLPVAAQNGVLAHAGMTGGGLEVSSLSAFAEETPPPSPETVVLTLAALPENVSLVSVTTNDVAVVPVGDAYTVYSNATAVATFAPAEGYELTGNAAVSVVVDGDKTLTGIPEAVSVRSLVKINEIMASNPSLDKGGITNALGIGEMDWVEFYNGSSQAIDLAGWYLSDNDKAGKETKATILGSCVIPAGGYKIVWLDKIHVDPSEYGPNEAFAVLKLSSSGDLIQLADPGTNVIDKIDFKTKKQIKGYSYGPLAVVSGGNLIPGNGDPVYMKTATPGAPNATEGWGDFTPAVTFSEPHGWKTEAFDLTLSCPDDPTAAIYYTLDGSSPTTASILYTNAIPIAKTTIVRAAVPDPTSVLQFDTSATYLFLEEVLAQGRTTTAPAGTVGFPNNSSKQAMLYGMLQLTGEDRERMLEGFTNAIPTISVVTDPGNLFNSTTGIYVNAKGEGVEWERPIMLEQFDPTGVGADFSQPAGIRIRGGNSRQPTWAKHAIRFFFRSSYGESSLAQKMFPGELPKEAGEYDKLDLRCSQNFSWANAKSTMDTFVTEVFARDSQRDMGQPYTRSRYCHLFLNGQYWGLYQTQERGDEHWGESYLGGDSLQYDVIKAASSWSTGRLGYSIECNEGTWDAWSNLWEIATTQGFAGDYTNNYNKILGLDPDGTRNPNYPILLNAASLRAFMFSTHFMVDKDGPTSPYSGIDVGHANNFNAVRNRDDAGDVSGFVFLRHDAEVSMAMEDKVKADKNPTFWGTDAPDAPTVGSPDPSGLGKLKFRTIPYFTPAELHYLLMQNPVYAREYADAFYEFFLKEGGAMTVEKSTARYASRMAEIDNAIVCEQARWAQNGQTRSTWLSACNTATNFIKNRVGYMKSQYQSAGWYPSIEPPAIGDATGAAYEGDVVPYGELVYLASAVADGTIYYTTNGVDDPMDAGLVYTDGFPIPDTGFIVRARVFKDNEWSALQETALEADVPNDQRYGIRVAAILNAAVNDPADEFVVLTNTLDRAVDLQGLSIWSEKAGKALTKLAEFTNAVELAAGGTITLTQPANWIGDAKLKNGGIFVELHDFNGKRIQNVYVDSESWFWTGEYDEKGKKVCICNKTGRWFVALEFPGDTEKGEVTLESQWTTSPEPPEPPAPATLVKINEIMASNPSPDKGGITNALGIGEMDWVEFYNGSSQEIDLAGWFLSDNDKAGKETKATILGSCVIPAGGYKIVWLDKIHVDPSEYGPNEAFAVLKLSSSGDLIQLADPGTNVIDKVDFKTKSQIKGYSYGPLAVESNGVLVPGTGDPVYMKTATPEAPNVTEGWGDFTPAVTFSEPHGYKTGAFSLTLSCADTNAAIYYTLDGSSPTTASILYTNAIPIAKTTVVRAAVPDPTSVLQFDTSATYIFLDDVLAQAQSKYAPESAVGFPDSGTVKNHKMLYGMRQDIVTGADRDRLLRGFTNSIATISLVIDPENLFNSSTGIYVNPAGRGEEWERQTMLEQINPLDPADGFSMPAGLRIRGSNSRTASRPKHALRLFFRSSYGMSSLEHKMFPGEPDKEAGEYDKLDLRCSQNFSWAGENNSADTFIHEVFSRDSQRDMGQFHTRSRYYNLFINGQYWGLYQTQERGDEHFAESYAGGDSLDWDVIKTTTHENEKYVLEADEGTIDAWSNLWETVVVNQAGLSADAIYQRVLGNNPDGTPNAAYPDLLNPTNLMAYVLITHYVVDGDGPVTPQSKHLNNMYALYDRTDGPTSVHGFFHLRHDAEMSFGKRGNVGYTADPTGWGSGDSSTVDGFNKYDAFWNTLEGFSPVKLHWELEKSAAYRRACADQFDKFFLRPGGAMTTEKNIERFAKRMAELDDAIVCEAARWGKGPDGTGSGYSRTTWLNACRTCTNGFLAVRMPYMLSQYRARGWYPSLDTPRVVNGSGDIYAEGGEVPYLEKVYLTGDAEGTTYYTLDGTDPMDAGATAYDGNGFAIPDEGATIRARTLKNGEWSALEEVTLESDVPNDQRYGIRVAAILNAAVNDPADEFIVLTNTLDRAVDLQGISIWSEKAGKTPTKLAEFTNSVELAAGGTITLTQPANWIGDAKLKNGGIFVELHDFNGKRIQNAYVDSESWFWTGEYDEKGKKVCVCNKTGRWFVALEFPGDTEKGEVTLESQWTTNSVAPAFPLPEDATAAEAVLAAVADNPAIGDWLVGIGQTERGYAMITNFTGDAEALWQCYLVDSPPEAEPEIQLVIPGISFDASGNVVVGGALLQHNDPQAKTVNGSIKLYYADDLGDLPASSDAIPLGRTFPVEPDAVDLPSSDVRFFQLRLE